MSPTPAPGLRERKKLRTKAAIRQQALRLFSLQGYDNTTMEQIAEAAEVSPSTVFRYFASKDELVLIDDYDPVFEDAFRAQPKELGPIQALRGALRDTLGSLSAGELAAERDRELQILAVPRLWIGSAQNVTRSMDLLAGLIAERAGDGVAADDPAVLTCTGAALGVMLEVVLRWAGDPQLDVLAELDAALARLADGLPLRPAGSTA
ncbi:MAG TPA: TetR family transcriptional regulator [Actinospica sp.]|nr:TetR family transcriptional regulator [Actinospica sp.]